MFVERLVRYLALFTNLVGWHVSAVSFPLSYVILAQLACPLSDVMFCLHSGITNLSLYKYCYIELVCSPMPATSALVYCQAGKGFGDGNSTRVKRFIVNAPDELGHVCI
jgi:hypothetical protein